MNSIHIPQEIQETLFGATLSIMTEPNPENQELVKAEAFLGGEKFLELELEKEHEKGGSLIGFVAHEARIAVVNKSMPRLKEAIREAPDGGFKGCVSAIEDKFGDTLVKSQEWVSFIASELSLRTFDALHEIRETLKEIQSKQP